MKNRNRKYGTMKLWRDTTPVFKASGRVSKMTAFSLIEVLIVMAVPGVLVAVAYPSYQSFVLRSRRATVQGEMQISALSM